MKSLKKIYSIVTTVLVAVVVIFAILLAGVRLVGLTPYTVLSGSMEPKYHVGSIIYVAKVDPAELEVDDPVTYRMPNGAVVTHAIIEVLDADDPTQRRFITQGLANDIADASPVPASSVIGKPVFSIPYLGYVSNYIQNPPGTYLAIAFFIAVLLLSFIPDLLSPGDKKAQTADGNANDSEPSTPTDPLPTADSNADTPTAEDTDNLNN